jgi:hypothetical protein
VPKDVVLSIGARQGTNSFGDAGYGGTCRVFCWRSTDS